MACSFHIDSVGLGDALTVIGWACPSAGDRIVAVGLVWEGDPDSWIPGEFGQPRPDVAAARGGAVECGFRIAGIPARPGRIYLLSLRLASGDTWTRRILRVEDRNGEIGCDFLTFRSRPAFRRLPAPALTPSLGHVLARYHPDPPPPPRREAPVLIVVAVYRRADLLGPFLDSLFAHTPSPFRLALVDDGGEDPAVTALFDQWRQRDSRVTTLTLERNRGFVAAVLHGFTLWQGETVVVANSDTLLPPFWLERLVAPLDRDPTIASTTPYSNAAQICGFPGMPGDNPLYLGLDPLQIDAAFAGLESGEMLIELPTGVGFCMAMSRHALDRIGFFEAETFGRGYGEENDWCRKAVRAGFRNVLVPNLFVYHQHGASFSSDVKRRQIERNLRILEERYPDYPGAVQDHVLADPGLGWRRFVAFLLAARHHPAGALLAISGAETPGPALRGRLTATLSTGRPLVLATRVGLGTLVTFHWPEGWLQWPTVSLADLAALCDKAAIGAILVGDLAATPLPATLQAAAAALQSDRTGPVEFLDPCPVPSRLDAFLAS